MLYKRVELTDGTPVQFLGIYATRWPYDSGVEPTVGFIEDDSESAEANAKTIETLISGKAQLEAERDELRHKLNSAMKIGREVMAERDELREALAQAGKDIAEYRAECERMTRQAMTA